MVNLTLNTRPRPSALDDRPPHSKMAAGTKRGRPSYGLAVLLLYGGWWSTVYFLLGLMLLLWKGEGGAVASRQGVPGAAHFTRCCHADPSSLPCRRGSSSVHLHGLWPRVRRVCRMVPSRAVTPRSRAARQPRGRARRPPGECRPWGGISPLPRLPARDSVVCAADGLNSLGCGRRLHAAAGSARCPCRHRCGLSTGASVT